MDIKEHENHIIVHNALFLLKQQTLIIADLHLGFDESLRNQGVMLPLTNTKIELSNLKKILEALKKYDVKNIVFNGDIKHEFGAVLKYEDKSFKQLLDLSQDHNLYFIKGNHDKIVEAYLSRVNKFDNVYLTDMLIIDDYIMIHGDSTLDKFVDKDKIVVSGNGSFDNKTLIIGHEHPVVSLEDSHRSEKYKALLISKEVIVLPSFHPAILGVEINEEFNQNQYLSPVLNDIQPDDFEVFLFGDDIDSEIFYFGKLKDIV